MVKRLTEAALMRSLDFAYDRAVNGVEGLDSAIDLADKYLQGPGSKRQKVARLLEDQEQAQAGDKEPFLDGPGVVIVIPGELPEKIAHMIYARIRTVAAIAHMGGYDLGDSRVKSLVYACLTGDGANSLLREAGVVTGRKLTEGLVNGISQRVAAVINYRVNLNLLSRFTSSAPDETSQARARSTSFASGFVEGVTAAAGDSMKRHPVGNMAMQLFIRDTDA